MSYECNDEKCLIVSSCGKYKKSKSVFSSEKDTKIHIQREHLKTYICKICGFRDRSLRSLRFHFNFEHGSLLLPSDTYFDTEDWESTLKFDLEKFYFDKIAYFPDFEDESFMEKGRWMCATEAVSQGKVELPKKDTVKNESNVTNGESAQYRRDLVVIVEVLDTVSMLQTVSVNLVEKQRIPDNFIRKAMIIGKKDISVEMEETEEYIAARRDVTKPFSIQSEKNEISDEENAITEKSDNGEFVEALEFSTAHKEKKNGRCTIS